MTRITLHAIEEPLLLSVTSTYLLFDRYFERQSSSSHHVFNQGLTGAWSTRLPTTWIGCYATHPCRSICFCSWCHPTQKILESMLEENTWQYCQKFCFMIIGVIDGSYGVDLLPGNDGWTFGHDCWRTSRHLDVSVTCSSEWHSMTRTWMKDHRYTPSIGWRSTARFILFGESQLLIGCRHARSDWDLTGRSSTKCLLHTQRQTWTNVYHLLYWTSNRSFGIKTFDRSACWCVDTMFVMSNAHIDYDREYIGHVHQ